MPRVRAALLPLALGLALVPGRDARAQDSAPPAPPREEPVLAPQEEALDALRSGDPATAVEIGRRRVALAGELGLAKLQADVRTNPVARALAMAGDHAAALREIDAAEAFFVAAGDVENQVAVMANRGIVLRLMGDFTEALRIQRRVLASREASGVKADIAGALNNVGVAESMRGNYRASAEAFERALTLTEDPDDRHRLIGNLALTPSSPW